VPVLEPVGLYLFWELAVTLACLVSLARIRPPSLLIILLIASNVTLSALSATLLSFPRLNSPAAYVLLGIVFLLFGLLAGSRRRDVLRALFQHPVQNLSQSAALWFLLGVVLVLSVGPVEEIDTLYNLHYVMDWATNQASPYRSPFNYVPFWELTYVPGLVLTHSDLFLWFNSLKPVLLLGLVLFLIAGELDLPERLTLWALPSLLLFPSLWLGPSGVATIKNDMIHACGYALAALLAMRTARGRAGKIDVALAGFAAVFVSTKFSGPVVLAAGTLVVAVAAAGWIRHHARTAATAASTAGVFWFIATGHYYVHNFLVYGSPFYPHQINLGPIHLPGTADLSGTSILYSLGDSRLWRYFFLPDRGLSPAGALFPVILPAILLVSLWLAGRAVLRRKVDCVAALALFQLVAWGIYFRSTYSASGWPGDLAFVANGLNSLRYVEGALLAGELGLLWALLRAGVPRAWVLALVTVHGASRLWLIIERAADPPWALALTLGTALAMFPLLTRRRMLAVPAMALVVFGLFSGAYLIERRRPLWLASLQPLYLPLYDAPGQDVFYVIDNEFTQQPCWQFPFLGHRLQHRVESGSREQLQSRLQSRPGRPRYVAWSRATPEATALSLPGYAVVASTPQGILLERQ